MTPPSPRRTTFRRRKPIVLVQTVIAAGVASAQSARPASGAVVK